MMPPACCAPGFDGNGNVAASGAVPQFMYLYSDLRVSLLVLQNALVAFKVLRKSIGKHPLVVIGVNVKSKLGI